MHDRMRLQFEVEQFLYREAALLDARDYETWLSLVAEDIHYWMPVRRTTTAREAHNEFTRPGQMAFFDDDLSMLKVRVAKMTGSGAWSEEPPSRTRHNISNVRIIDVVEHEVSVELNFHLYRTRLESEEDSWLGRRVDTLRQDAQGFELAKRHIFLDQTTILAQNMSNLF